MSRVFAPNQPANVDARLQNNSEDQLVASLRGLTLQSTDLPLRPGFGTTGTAIKLRTNFFQVRVPKGPLHEYDVQIAPAVAIKRVKKRIFELAEATSDWTSKGLKNNVAHDSSAKLIAAKALPQPLSIDIPFSDEDEGQQPAKAPKGGKPSKPKDPKVYTLTIKFVQQLETQSLTKYVSIRTFIFSRGNAKSLEVDTFDIITVRVSSSSRRLLILVFSFCTFTIGRIFLYGTFVFDCIANISLY